MKTLGALFFRGLAAILPLALTGYLVWAAVSAGEALLRNGIEWLFGELGLGWEYWPGMGFAVSIVLVLAVGLLMYSFLVRAIYHRFTALLKRIPVVNSVFSMIVDVVHLFGGEDRPLHKVVLVRIDAGHEMLGFLTREDVSDLPGFTKGRCAVYVPLSYQIGGFTIMVARDQVRDVAMGSEEAMRFCITAGVSRRPKV